MRPPLGFVIVAALAAGAFGAPEAGAAIVPPFKPSRLRAKRPSPKPVRPRPVAATVAASPSPSAGPTPAASSEPVFVPVEVITIEVDRARPGRPAADPTPPAVVPALRLGASRPLPNDAVYAFAGDMDAALWQGDWAIAGTLLTLSPNVSNPRPGPPATQLATVGLRTRALGPLSWELGAGWLASAPAMPLVTLATELDVPVRPRWWLDAGARVSLDPRLSTWVADGRLGLRTRLGPLGFGVGVRHATLNAVAGGLVMVTGPQLQLFLGP